MAADRIHAERFVPPGGALPATPRPKPEGAPATKAHRLDVVIDVSNAVYFKPALDITKEAVAAYDKTYPSAATAAAAK